MHVTGLHILQFQEAVIGVKTKHKLGVNLSHKICYAILKNAIRLDFVFILNQTRPSNSDVRYEKFPVSVYQENYTDIIGILNKVKVLLTLLQILTLILTLLQVWF